MKYYSPTKINKKNATYNVIFGERSNGKTYALLLQSIKNYVKDGSQMAYVRRWKEDITGRRAQRLFEGINANNEAKLPKKNITESTTMPENGFFVLMTITEKQSITIKTLSLLHLLYRTENTINLLHSPMLEQLFLMSS